MQTICSRFHASCIFVVAVVVAVLFDCWCCCCCCCFGVRPRNATNLSPDIVVVVSFAVCWCHRQCGSFCQNAMPQKEAPHTCAPENNQQQQQQNVFWGQHTPFNTHYEPELFAMRCVGLNYVGNVIVRFNTTTRDDINFHQHHVATWATRRDATWQLQLQLQLQLQRHTRIHAPKMAIALISVVVVAN